MNICLLYPVIVKSQYFPVPERLWTSSLSSSFLLNEADFIMCEQISLIESLFYLTCDIPVFCASLTISEIIIDCIFIFQGVVKKVDRVPS
jgi:hypothetical protein